MAEAASMQLSSDGVVQVSGEMVFATVNDLRLQGVEMLAKSQNTVVDLSAVTRADSAGLSLLLEWLRVARNSGTSLMFHHVPSQLEVIAQLSGLDEMIALGRSDQA